METFAPKGKICGPILPQFVLEKPITFGAKIMYALLCNYASEKDHCWPSHATLAARLSCSVSSVKKYLTELVGENLISIQRGRYRSCLYYLLRPEGLKSEQPRAAHRQSHIASHEVKSGYIHNLKKQNKEKDSPLSPVASEQPQSFPSAPAPAAGGVSSSVPDFESIWNLYPKKEAKGFARLAWLQLLRSGQLPPLPELHAAIQRFAASESWQREQGRFVPQMGNWLRGQRWLDPLPPAEQAEQRRDLELRRAMQAREEQERRLLERKKAEKACLRPLFEAFAAKFAPLAADAMAFGIWLHLHSLNCAPSADDVPPGNTLGISEFLQDYKRRRQTADYRTQREAPLNVRKDAGKTCRSVGKILKGMAAPFHPGGAFSARPEFSVTAYA